MTDETMSNMILQFPRPAESGATRIQIWRSDLRALVGKVLNRVGIAGAVRDCEIDDDVSGNKLQIHSSPRFTRISINGRDFYFDRLTGRFDGTGSGCG